MDGDTLVLLVVLDGSSHSNTQTHERPYAQKRLVKYPHTSVHLEWRTGNYIEISQSRHCKRIIWLRTRWVRYRNSATLGSLQNRRERRLCWSIIYYGCFGDRWQRGSAAWLSCAAWTGQDMTAAERWEHGTTMLDVEGARWTSVPRIIGPETAAGRTCEPSRGEIWPRMRDMERRTALNLLPCYVYEDATLDRYTMMAVLGREHVIAADLAGRRLRVSWLLYDGGR